MLTIKTNDTVVFVFSGQKMEDVEGKELIFEEKLCARLFCA